MLINASLEHAQFVRALAGAAYARGADYVDVLYSDKRISLARLERAAEETLEQSPEWLVHRMEAAGQSGAALT